MKKLLLIALLACLGSSNSFAQCFANGTSQSPSCGGSCTGSLFIVFSTNNFPITLTINGVLVPGTVTSVYQQGGLCPGIYNFLAIDANGDTCSGSTTIIVPMNQSPTISVNVINASCQGCNDGSAMVNVSGGTPPYTYFWSNGANTQSLFGLTVGNYTVTVTDANGCSALVSFAIGVGNNGFYNISGDVYLDLNSNGIKDVGEIGLANQIVEVQPGGLNAYSGSSGQYHAIVPPGTYDVSYPTAVGWNLTSTPASYNITVATSSISGLDFGVYPDSTFGSAIAFLNGGWPRCFWDVPSYPRVYNNGYTILDGTLTYTHDPLQTYVSSTIAPTTAVGNTLTFDFTNLAPGQSFAPSVTFTLPAGGTVLTGTAIVDATDIFSNVVQDTATFTQTVTCSYDPNDKAVSPAGLGSANFVGMDEWLTYQVRFQNTGTDTAFKVVILDTLDLGLDLNTFTVIGASHTVSTNISAAREISFTFNNILLPDSNVNEPLSHGYVLYRIKGLANNPDPTAINNTAYIYFDLNPPVQTNTTLTTLSDNWLSLSEYNSQNLFDLFPNPMNESALLKLKNYKNESYNISILDVTGRVVQSEGILSNGSYIINKATLQSSMYFIRAENTVTSKVVMVKLVVK